MVYAIVFCEGFIYSKQLGIHTGHGYYHYGGILPIHNN